jgi:RES domain
VLRDQRNGVVGNYPIAESELHERHFAEIDVKTPLDLIDLRGNGPIRMGVPSDVAHRQDQSLARDWSLAFYQHPTAPDGIIYPSRLNGETNLAIYGRAVKKLAVSGITLLINAPGLPPVLNNLKVALV